MTVRKQKAGKKTNTRTSKKLKKSTQPVTAIQAKNTSGITPDKLLPLFVIVLVIAISYFFWSARALTSQVNTQTTAQHSEQVHRVSASDEEPTPTPKPVAPPLTNADITGDYKTSIFQPALSQMANVTFKFQNNGQVDFISDADTNHKHGTWTFNQPEQTLLISLTDNDEGPLGQVEVIKLQAEDGRLVVSEQEHSEVPAGTMFTK
ncbi:hypothetical protein IJJ27_00870 [bacterium]|nr:hypothetical protein [bacterium]